MGNRIDNTLAAQITSVPSVDNRQLLKLITQYFYSLGEPTFDHIADDLVDKTGIQLSDGQTAQLTELLTSPDKYNLEQKRPQRLLSAAVAKLSPGSPNAQNAALALVFKHLFLEALFIDGNRTKALRILRNMPDAADTGADATGQYSRNQLLIRSLSSLLTDEKPSLQTLEDLHWPTTATPDLRRSRQLLLQSVFELLPPGTSPDPDRLVTLLDEALSYQQLVNPYYIPPFKNEPATDDLVASSAAASAPLTLYRDFGKTLSPQDRLDQLPLKLKKNLSDHDDEVWYVRYSNSGRFLASASIDKSITIYDAQNDYAVYKQLVGHKGSIIYLSWSQDDSHIISSSFDQTVKIWDLETDAVSSLRSETFFNTNLRVWSVEFLDDNDTFVIGSPDKELAIFNREEFMIHDFSPEYRIDDLTVVNNEKLYAITHTCELLIYNLRDKDYRLINKVSLGKKLTAITHDPADPDHILINLKPDELQLWNVHDPERPYIENKYYGLQQSEYIIRGALSDRNLVFSGSEDGLIYVWNERFGNLISCLKGHTSLISCIAWRPNPEGTRQACEWASCSDDGHVNVWGYLK